MTIDRIGSLFSELLAASAAALCGSAERPHCYKIIPKQSHRSWRRYLRRVQEEVSNHSHLDMLVPMMLRFTDDPSVIGIPRMPDSREKIKKMKEQYWSEATEEVDFEEVDAGLDDIFKPLPPYAASPDSDSAGLS